MPDEQIDEIEGQARRINTGNEKTHLFRTGRGKMRTIQLTILTLTIFAAIPAATATGQIAGVQPEVSKQSPALLPKLALKGAIGETKSGVQYHKIILTITNWEKYNPSMFVLPNGKKLPANACAGVKSRVMVAVFSDRRTLLSDCIPIAERSALGSFSFLIKKGSTVPQFIYAVMNDQYTGAVYRSNLVSPMTGETK